MSRASLLQETVSWMDTVDLALCLFIYEVCNDCQFERKPAYLLHGVLRVTDYQTARTRQTLGRRVPETLRHIQVLL